MSVPEPEAGGNGINGVGNGDQDAPDSRSTDCAEGSQILRYESGQQYRLHRDGFDPAKPDSQRYLARGGQRVGTLVICLQVVGVKTVATCWQRERAFA